MCKDMCEVCVCNSFTFARWGLCTQLCNFCQMRSVHAIPSLLPDWMYTCNYFTKHKLTQMSIPVCMCFVIQLGVGTGLCSTLVFNSAPVQGATPGSKGHLAMEDIIHHQSDSGSESLDTPVKKHASPDLLTPSPVGQQHLPRQLASCGDKPMQGMTLDLGGLQWHFNQGGLW